MLKSLCMFVCLAAGVTIAHAQALSAVKFSVPEGLTGQAIEVWPEFSGPQSGRGGECAIFINFGDGGTQQVKIDPAKPPVKAGHVYQTAGNYVVTIEGKTIFRGFNSTSACDGKNLSAAFTVRDAKMVAQEAEKKAASERAAAVDPTARLMVLAQVGAQAGAAAQKSGQGSNGLDAQAQAQATREFDAGLGKLNAGQLFALADQLNAQNQSEYARMALRKLVIQYSDHPLAATAAKMLADSAAAKAPAPAPAATPGAPAKADDTEARVIQQQEEEMKRIAQQRAQNDKAAPAATKAEKPAPAAPAAPAAKASAKKMSTAECDAALDKMIAQFQSLAKTAPQSKDPTTNKQLDTRFRLYTMAESMPLIEKGCKVPGAPALAEARKAYEDAAAECRKIVSRAEDCNGKKPW